MTATYELPTAPKLIKRGYWSSPSSEPQVADRWIVTAFREQQYNQSMFWMGSCMNCGVPTWQYENGNIDDYFGNAGLVPVPDPESGVMYRACYRCGSNESRTAVVIRNGRQRIADGNEDVSPIRWPVVEARERALTAGKKKLRTRVVRSG